MANQPARASSPLPRPPAVPRFKGKVNVNIRINSNQNQPIPIVYMTPCHGSDIAIDVTSRDAIC